MAKSYSKIIVVGNNGSDGELRYLPTGTAVTEWSVAVSHNFKKGEEWQTETDWWRVKMFGQAAERAAEQIKKGKLVLVEGTPRQRSWEDNDGKKRTVVEIMADRYVLLSPKEQNGNTVESSDEVTPF